METQLFEWDDVDIINELVMVFYHVTRKSDGQYFPMANLNYEQGIVSYLDDQGEILESHRLILTSELIND